ncbi:MAG: NrfD/PsrC family molybdoenzyme membrane anchor subunit [Chloroflexota bacterium]|nr:NrfD/PsrC family molybdoenzyme membrane anchor subunit [Chloroflexota bacterium]
MQERITRTEAQVNKDLLRPVLGFPIWLLPAAGFAALVVAVGSGAVGWLINQGLGVTGLNRPVYWGFLITTFVFWVGISHAGVMLSAILRLTHAEWRRPMVRAAEVLTVFSLATAALLPVIHSGRPWRTLYWAFPYDFSRGIYPDPRSALIWDPAAIFTYLTGSLLFVVITLIPDIATVRDRATGWRKSLYGFMALGWRGTERQWRLQAIAGILLSALILPVFVSVHSIVSWDFGMAVSTETWHTSVFAPYFVIGAVHSGVAAVITLMVVMRVAFKWQGYIRLEHFDAIGRLLAVVAITWFFFLLMEFIFGLYSMEKQEIAVRELQLFTRPYNILVIIFLLCAFVIPVPLWFFRKVRRNVFLMLFTSILVNIGMWLERFILIVPGLSRRTPFSYTWNFYAPSVVEVLIVAGTFGLVILGVLTFAKLFPLIPLAEEKEGQVMKAEVRIGKRKVPAVVKED